MLRTVKAMEGFAIGAKDGDIGEIADFIFDDKTWTIRTSLSTPGSGYREDGFLFPRLSSVPLIGKTSESPFCSIRNKLKILQT